MKQLLVIVKPFRAEVVLGILAEKGITDVIIREAKGYSRQKGYLERYVGSEYSLAFLPKVEITAWVPEEQANTIAQEIAAKARTGRIGDGKVFQIPCPDEMQIEF